MKLVYVLYWGSILLLAQKLVDATSVVVLDFN